MTELTAGRELDALIAEKVMGWKLDYEFADYVGAPTVPALRDQYDEWGILPEFSTDISAAWQVVEKLQQLEDYVDFSISHNINYATYTARYGLWKWATADTAPLAISLAALKVVEATQKEQL